MQTQYAEENHWSITYEATNDPVHPFRAIVRLLGNNRVYDIGTSKSLKTLKAHMNDFFPDADIIDKVEK